MNTINYNSCFDELSADEYEQINGGFGIIMTIAAWAILGTFFVAPVAVGVTSVVVDQYKKVASQGARRGTVDAYTDYNYDNR